MILKLTCIRVYWNEGKYNKHSWSEEKTIDISDCFYGDYLYFEEVLTRQKNIGQLSIDWNLYRVSGGIPNLIIY